MIKPGTLFKASKRCWTLHYGERGTLQLASYDHDIQKGEYLIFISETPLAPEWAPLIGLKSTYLLLRARGCSLVYLGSIEMETIG